MHLVSDFIFSKGQKRLVVRVQPNIFTLIHFNYLLASSKKMGLSN